MRVRQAQGHCCQGGGDDRRSGAAGRYRRGGGAWEADPPEAQGPEPGAQTGFQEPGLAAAGGGGHLLFLPNNTTAKHLLVTSDSNRRYLAIAHAMRVSGAATLSGSPKSQQLLASPGIKVEAAIDSGGAPGGNDRQQHRGSDPGDPGPGWRGRTDHAGARRHLAHSHLPEQRGSAAPPDVRHRELSPHRDPDHQYQLHPGAGKLLVRRPAVQRRDLASEPGAAQLRASRCSLTCGITSVPHEASVAS